MIDLVSSNQAAIWFVVGFLLLAIDALAFGFASGVLLFVGLGAVVTGALLWFGLVPNAFIVAVACFAISTAVITAILWGPLKRLQSTGELGKDRSSDIIGHSFNLNSDISRTVSGEQKYSGINWRVEPATDLAEDSIAAGTRVEVRAVSVGVFFVKPV